MNKCGINGCATSDNRFLWACQGTCKRHFHAACVGSQRHHEELLRTFMLPLCIECQQEFSDQLEMQKLIRQQRTLTEEVKAQVKSTHALIQKFKDMALTHETLDTIEQMLTELRSDVKQINSTTNSSASNMSSKLIEIASHCASLPTDTLFDEISETNQLLKKTNQHFSEALVKHLSETPSNELFLRIEDKISANHDNILALQAITEEFPSELTRAVDEIKSLATRTPAVSIADELR